MKKFFPLVAFLCAASFAAHPSYAAEKSGVTTIPNAKIHMQVYGMSLPPIGHIQFCADHKDECERKTPNAKTLSLTPQRWSELINVNTIVNQVIAPVSDQDLYGKAEYWSYPDKSGDCEDYVLLKRRMLMDRGWPSGALLITVVLDENNEGHAVLTVRTNEGEYLLDNKTMEIVEWRQSSYSFIKRQSHRDPRIWVSLTAEDGFAPVSATNATRMPFVSEELSAF